MPSINHAHKSHHTKKTSLKTQFSSKIQKSLSMLENFFMKQWDKLINKIISLTKFLEKKIPQTKKLKIKKFRDSLEEKKFNQSFFTKIKTKINKVKKEANEVIDELLD